MWRADGSISLEAACRLGSKMVDLVRGYLCVLQLIWSVPHSIFIKAERCLRASSVENLFVRYFVSASPFPGREVVVLFLVGKMSDVLAII